MSQWQPCLMLPGIGSGWLVTLGGFAVPVTEHSSRCGGTVNLVICAGDMQRDLAQQMERLGQVSGMLSSISGAYRRDLIGSSS